MIIKSLIAFFGFFACVVAGLFLAYNYWPPDNSRDFRFGATISSVLVVILTFLLCVKWKWSLTSLLLSLIPIEIVTLITIMFYSGSHSLDSFNLSWLMFLNRYMALPWIIGIGIGVIYKHVKAK